MGAAPAVHGSEQIAHHSHDVKVGFGGNDVLIGASPVYEDKKTPRGMHNTLVQENPGNLVVMQGVVSGEIEGGSVGSKEVYSQAEDAESLLGEEEAGVALMTDMLVARLLNDNSLGALNTMGRNLGAVGEASISDMVLFIAQQTLAISDMRGESIDSVIASLRTVPGRVSDATD